MKVIHVKDDFTKLTKSDQERLAILKLMDNGQYVEGVGIKDNDYFLLVEDDIDETYLANYFQQGLSPGSKAMTRDAMVEAVQVMLLIENINAKKEILGARYQEE